MEEPFRKPDEQLNTVPGEAEFSIDDIVAEFSAPEEDTIRYTPVEEAPKVPEGDTVRFIPVGEQAEDAEESSLLQRLLERFRRKKAEDAPTEEAPTVEEEPPAAEEEPPVEDAPEEEPEPAEGSPDEAYDPDRPSAAEEWLLRVVTYARSRRTEEPEPLPPPEEAEARYTAARSRMTLPLLLSWMLTILGGAASVMVVNPQWLAIPHTLYNSAMTGFFLVQLLLTFPLLTRGLKSLVRGKFTLHTFLLLTAAVVLIHALKGLGGEKLNLCAAGSFLLTVALWGERLLLTAKHRSLAAALVMDHPLAAAKYRDVWNGMDGLYRRPAEKSHLVEELESPPDTEKTLQVLAPILAALTLTAALFAAIKGSRDFLWAWSALLLGACPLGGALAYSRSFCKLTIRLIRGGAAITGWAGAKHLCGNACVVITDRDLFPANALVMHGIKTLGSRSAEQLLGYATALLERAETGSAKLFSQTLEAQNGRRFRAENFRFYDGGGLGGEVCGEIVLLGSRSFMRLMGVYMPEDPKLADGLYLSIGGEVAGVFAVTYRVSDAARSGLNALLGSPGLTPILATRDLLLTPETVEEKFRLPVERLEFPVIRERIALTERSGEAGGEEGALLARGSFLSFSLAIAGARHLRRRTVLATAVAAGGAILGLLVMTLLVLLGAESSVTAMNLLLYHCLWLLPSGLLTMAQGK